jgi:hypothetical protein
MAFSAASYKPRAIKSARLATFTGTPGTAILETGESEGNIGGMMFVRGVRPLVDVTVNAVTIAIGYRNDQNSTPTYTSEVTANSRSGECNFRNEARFQRVRMTVTGTFNSAQGVGVDAIPSGGT